jgi:hypothetical protein
MTAPNPTQTQSTGRTRRPSDPSKAAGADANIVETTLDNRCPQSRRLLLTASCPTINLILQLLCLPRRACQMENLLDRMT